MTHTTWPTFLELLQAHRTCRRRKQPSEGQLRFEKHLGHNLLHMQWAIQNERWQPRPYTSFVVLNPKPREIFAAHIADRVVHHLVVSELEKYWKPKFSPHSFACLSGRGPYAALQYFQKHVRRISRGGRRDVWVLQLDIANFFATIHRPILEELVLPHIQNPKLCTLVKTLLRHNPREHHKPVSPEATFAKLPQHKRWQNQPEHCGLPIGNLTSQFFANVLLTGLDHFIARTLKPKAYLRYMDDLSLLASTPQDLSALVEPIATWLATYRQQNLNPQKTVLSNLRNGVKYLGFHIHQVNSPQNPAQLRLPPIKKYKIVQAAQTLERRGYPASQCLDPIFHIISHRGANHAFSSLNARLGQASHAQTFRWRKGVLAKLALRQKILIKKGYRAANPKE